MTRFGRWFTGALLAVVGLFAVLLMLPSPARRPGANVAPDALSPAGAGGREEAITLPSGSVAADGAGTLTVSGLVLPVAGVRPTQLSDSFGDPRGGKGERGHRALDIMAPLGTPVLAAADGIVEKLFESALGGHTIYIRSPNRRNVYYYAHLDTYAPGVREGISVRAGQRLGTVGASGDADPGGPHLHFEITRVDPGGSPHEGRPINPYPLLAGAAAGG